ncbi:MAG: DUF4132 domain-containing protein [Lyngbya sp. HA4199-MV5]|jgi:hypothetical protein|nr:DUF4132 domain-containing protein [Lyngbya sp. HA4199-MV5]
MTEPASTQTQKPEKPSAIGSDGFPIYSHSLYAEQQTAINPVIEQALRSYWYYWDSQFRSYPSIQTILKQNFQFQIKTIFAIFERLTWLNQEVLPHPHSYEHLRMILVALGQLLDAILQRKLPYTEVDLLGIVRWCVLDYYQDVYRLADRFGTILPLARILRCIENYAKQNRLSQDLLLHIRGLPDLGLRKTERATYDRILLTQSQEIDLLRLIEVRDGEPWAYAAFEQINALEPSQREQWGKLLLHASTASQSTPSQKWLDAAQPLLNAVGIEEFKHSIGQWFPLVEQPTKQSRNLYSCHDLISDRNKAILTGLVWCCSFIQDEAVLQWLADLTVQCFKKVPGVGPLCLKVGNAGLWLLSEVGTPAAIDRIEKLRQKVKHKSVQKQIEKAFDRAAEKAGLSRQDLEELAIPTYNLDATGTLHQSLGSVVATLKVVGTQQVELSWLKSDGKPQKSVPAEVKQNFATELKTLKRTADDIKKTLLAQRDRLEQLYLSHRTWNFSIWRDRYLNHPLLAHLTRRLIWNFEQDGQTQLGIWHDGQLIDVSGNPLTNLSDRAQVTLWHPITSSTEGVLAWRVWLETQMVVQPFKQAHREVYLLTDAERQTHTYSNRFAAHIIRQHQFANLCQQRGWHYSLQGDFDSHNIPTWNLPQWDLQIQFWVDPASHEVAETHIYLYLSTDQVRFCAW